MGKGICAWCGELGELRKSHIIPDAFTADLRDKAGMAPVIIERGVPYTRRAPGGLYQQNLLCDACEARLGVFDQAAAEAFIHRYDDWGPLMHQGEILAWRLPFHDSGLIHRFGLSVLIRGHLTNLDAFRQVNLGRRLEAAKAICDSDDPLNPEAFPLVLARFHTSERYPGSEKLMVPPARSRSTDQNVISYAWNAAGFRFVQVTDSQGMPGHARWQLVGDQPYLFAVALEFGSRVGEGHMKDVSRAAVRFKRLFKPPRD